MDVKSVVHISPIPYGIQKVSPVGRYLLDLSEQLQGEDGELKQIVLCQRDEAPLAQTAALELRPVFTFGPSALWQIDRALPAGSNALVHVQYETAIFGSVIASLTIPYFVSRWKRRGYRVVITLHHVIPKKFSVADLRLWKPADFFDPIIPFVLRILQGALSRVADHVIVHEHSHFRILERTKISRIPVMLRRSKSRVNLSSNVGHLRLCFFGFLANYKGIIELVTAINELANENVMCELTIVGTLHPRLRKSAPYKDFLSDLMELADCNPLVHLAGFLPDHLADEVLLEADFVMLPYKASISASAALARAWSLGAAVAVSDVLHREYELPPAIPSFKPTVAGIKSFLRDISRVAVEEARRHAATECGERDATLVARKTLAVYESRANVEATIATSTRAEAIPPGSASISL